MNDSAKEEAREWIKDIVAAVLVISVIMGSLYAYTGIWPPMVVIESGSMQHSDSRSYVGVIDTGDIVLVKESDFSEIKTYAEGRATGYERYGDFGDVIIYRPMGQDITPIIHRAIVYLEWNSTGCFDVSGLRALEYGEDYISDSGSWHGIHRSVTIYDYGYGHKNLVIRLDGLLRYHHSGYITGGDHNIARGYGVDQNTGICPEHIESGWIVGKAVGELPWFGLIKLSFSGSLHENPAPTNSWVMLTVSIIFILILPYIVDKTFDKIREKKQGTNRKPQPEEGDSEEKSEESG